MQSNLILRYKLHIKILLNKELFSFCLRQNLAEEPELKPIMSHKLASDLQSSAGITDLSHHAWLFVFHYKQLSIVHICSLQGWVVTLKGERELHEGAEFLGEILNNFQPLVS